MRLTGQSTTAIGNVITNMQVHKDFIRKNIDILQKMCMLGDDAILLFKQKPSIYKLKQQIKVKYNMLSK